MINGYIDINTRTGTLDANVNSCAKETIVFNVSFDAGLTVAILDVDGKTLAISKIEEATPYSVTINTATVQAYELTRELGAGQSLPIVIAIGGSNHLQALVTGRMQFNPLYDKSPPTELAPQYPTSAELQNYLNAMLDARAGIDSVVEDAKTVLCDTIDKFTAETCKTITDWCADVASTKNELSETVESATQSLGGTVANANTTINSAIDTAKNDLNSTIDTAKQKFDTAVEEVTHIADGKADKSYVEECNQQLNESINAACTRLNTKIVTHESKIADIHSAGHIRLFSCITTGCYALLDVVDNTQVPCGDKEHTGMAAIQAATYNLPGVVKIGNPNDIQQYQENCYAVAPMKWAACCLQRTIDNICIECYSYVTYGTLTSTYPDQNNTITVPLKGINPENYNFAFSYAQDQLNCGSPDTPAAQALVTAQALLNTLANSVFSCAASGFGTHNRRFAGAPVYIEDVCSLWCQAAFCFINHNRAAFVPAATLGNPGVGYALPQKYLDCGEFFDDYVNGIPTFLTRSAVMCLILNCSGDSGGGGSSYFHYDDISNNISAPDIDMACSDSVVIGKLTCAINYSVAIGNCSCSGNYGIAIGNCSCSGNYGIAIGNCSCSRNYGIAIGNCSCSGNYGIAIGSDTKATNGVAIGRGLNLSVNYDVGGIRFFYCDTDCLLDTPSIFGLRCERNGTAYFVFGRGNSEAMANGIAIAVDCFIEFMVRSLDSSQYTRITNINYSSLC